MYDILIHILAYIFVAVVTLGLIGLVVTMFRMIFFPFSEKKKKGCAGSIPWWVWWASTRHD